MGEKESESLGDGQSNRGEMKPKNGTTTARAREES